MEVLKLSDVNVPKGRIVQHNKSDVYKQNEEIFDRLTKTGNIYIFLIGQQKKFLEGHEDIKLWNDPIEVPFGVPSTFFIARVAIINGFTFQDINLYPELGGIYKYGQKVPEFVQEKIHSVNLKEIYGEKIRDSTISENIYMYKHVYKSN